MAEFSKEESQYLDRILFHVHGNEKGFNADCRSLLFLSSEQLHHFVSEKHIGGANVAHLVCNNFSLKTVTKFLEYLFRVCTIGQIVSILDDTTNKKENVMDILWREHQEGGCSALINQLLDHAEPALAKRMIDALTPIQQKKLLCADPRIAFFYLQDAAFSTEVLTSKKKEAAAAGKHLVTLNCQAMRDIFVKKDDPFAEMMRQEWFLHLCSRIYQATHHRDRNVYQIESELENIAESELKTFFECLATLSQNDWKLLLNEEDYRSFFNLGYKPSVFRQLPYLILVHAPLLDDAIIKKPFINNPESILTSIFNIADIQERTLRLLECLKPNESNLGKLFHIPGYFYSASIRHGNLKRVFDELKSLNGNLANLYERVITILDGLDNYPYDNDRARRQLLETINASALSAEVKTLLTSIKSKKGLTLMGKPTVSVANAGQHAALFAVGSGSPAATGGEPHRQASNYSPV